MPHLSRLSLNYCRCMVTASISTDAAPNLLNTVKRKNRRSDASDKFGLLGSFGRGLPFFRPSKNDTSDLQGDDTRKEYEKKTEGLRKFELKEQKTIPLISQPVSWTRVMKKKLERKKKALDEFKRLYGVDYEYARVLIRCARKEYNHYEGMKYPMKEIPLVSQYWIKPKYKNDWFIIEPVGKIPSFDHDRDYCWEQFFDTLDGNVVQNAINVGYLKPTTIQVQTFAAFASSSHLFILAETGSGKTAAYAIPLLSSLLKERRCEVDTKALVLVVSAELMVQTRRMIEKLAAGTGLKFYREDSESKEFDNAEDWDVLISTPGLACKVLSKCDTRLIKTVIFDEADMLLDDTFVSVLSEIFSLVKLRNSETNQNNHEGARIVFCSASCPDLLQDIVDSVVDAQSLYYVKSIHTHGLLPHVRQKFIRVRQMDKIDMLATILEKPNTRGQTIIFCKDKNTRSYVSKMLTARGINNSVLGDHDRKETFINLVDNDKGIIIATDLASRGLDLPNLSHVINYDFPRDMIDYIHRIGRVGRLSTKFRSRATSFVCTSLEVSLVNSIELAARFNQPVNSIKTNVSASFKQRKKLVENTS